MMQKISFSKAINLAFIHSMEEDQKVICMGLGVPDPKGYLEQLLIFKKSLVMKEFLISLHPRMH